ncbi:dipeptide-binding ABC transporter, periplasmic substrate-binding component [Sinorhizobium americanum]|uniref:Dipeptide-binding ABC transporter, periplasmic substrate-binding component n=1 Tax=Sinorhizobium americanum TaxID=194963 RepID=A0A1L3LJ57_9HYPH|nr:dipeptide-binding ABC transporter, periplasmic substrate-binding component [Sinorhizobium americanum CCGM7]APG90085.1 dipeptide-binding ABC transporter, periplasmic substrate-binding component [Sinorhizobium americanum]
MSAYDRTGSQTESLWSSSLYLWKNFSHRQISEASYCIATPNVVPSILDRMENISRSKKYENKKQIWEASS